MAWKKVPGWLDSCLVAAGRGSTEAQTPGAHEKDTSRATGLQRLLVLQMEVEQAGDRGGLHLSTLVMSNLGTHC